MVNVKRFVSALRGTSAARLFPGEEIVISVADVRGESAVVVRTRYEQLGDDNIVHRELWVEVSGPGDSLDEAMRRHAEVAGTIASVLTLATNAVVEDLKLEITFDATPSEAEHEIFQNTIADEVGLPGVSRHIDPEASLALFGAFIKSSASDRLFRAAGQYKLAIQHLQPGQEILALEHLYMAMEVLTPLARNEVINQYGSRDAVLSAWDIEIKKFDPEVRKRILFQGDERAYTESRAASDGFEHGYMDFSKIREHALEHARPVARYVREAILHYASLGAHDAESLRRSALLEPLPRVPMDRYLRATLVGDVEDLAPMDLQYPMFRVKTSIGSTTYDGERVEINPRIEITNLIGEKAQARDFTFEFWGPGVPTSDHPPA